MNGAGFSISVGPIIFFNKNCSVCKFSKYLPFGMLYYVPHCIRWHRLGSNVYVPGDDFQSQMAVSPQPEAQLNIEEFVLCLQTILQILFRLVSSGSPIFAVHFNFFM